MCEDKYIRTLYNKLEDILYFKVNIGFEEEPICIGDEWLIKYMNPWIDYWTEVGPRCVNDV